MSESLNQTINNVTQSCGNNPVSLERNALRYKLIKSASLERNALRYKLIQ